MKKFKKAVEQEQDGQAGQAEENPSWASAALPGTEAPDVSFELDVLTKGITGIETLYDKEDTIIVPTIFPGLNRAIRIGGMPTSCICLLHGPSRGGKTAIALGIVTSFQMQGHFGVYVDAEHTLDKPFSVFCGVDARQLQYIRPRTYEETTKKVEQLIDNMVRGRAKKTIHPARCMVIVVDSITKLVPEKELEDMAKTGKGYPLRALMNTNWMDRLTPMVGSLPILLVILAHEKVKIDAGMFEQKWRVKGGEALIYDSTIAIRSKVEGRRMVERGGKKMETGQVHHCVVEKNKVGICHEQFRFVMSNGKGGSPIGFDHADGLLEEAKLRGENPYLYRESGGVWYSKYMDGELKGDRNMMEWLRENSTIMNAIIEDFNASAVEAIVSDASEGSSDALPESSLDGDS